MTQPENAGEHDNSHDESNDETIDETKSKHNNESYDSSSSVEPASSTSMSSLNSDSICSAPTPPPSQPPLSSSSQPIAYHHPQYPYPYGYPWYPPPCHPMASQPSGENTSATNWHYPYALPPPPQTTTTPTTSESGEINNPPNWPYPYAMPPPPQRPASPAGDNMPPHPYAPYPYFYPYPYAMPPVPPQSSEFGPYLPPLPPYHTYPYPVAPSYSQSSNSSRASSALPDIIITPSTDDVPSKMIMQHHIKVEKEKPAKRSGSIDIQDVSTTIKQPSQPPAESSIVDILTQHLENLEQNMENNLNSSTLSTKKTYTKNFDQKSPDDNTSPVQITMVMTESEQDSDTESSDSDVTTKQYDTQQGVKGGVPAPLQSIRSVSNIQFYNGHGNGQNNHPQESDDDDDDSTTADGESDIFDEDDDEGTISGDFEYERRIEQPDSECEDYYVEDNLSVIYEEESDFEKSSELSKPFKMLGKSHLPDDLQKCIEENNDEEEEDETENLVTVSLPLKFSFTKSSKDEPITTVEVGKSFVEDRRHSLTLTDKRNSFSVATLNESDDDDDSDSCDVSVTISLTNSSRSGSVESKDGLRNMADKYPIEDMPLPEHALPANASSEEDVSFSFSLNKRNKFVGQTLNGDITNNIAHIENEVKLASTILMKSNLKQSTEELDFFATLMATKMQAQKIKDQTASYWGKSVEQKEEREPDKEEDKAGEISKEYSETDETNKYTDSPKTKEYPETDIETAKTKEYQASKDLANVKEVTANNSDDLKERSSFWANYSIKTNTECKELDVRPCEISEVKLETSPSPVESKKDTKSFWDTYSAEPKESESNQETEEIEDIWANRDDDFVAPKKSATNYWDRSTISAEIPAESKGTNESQGQSGIVIQNSDKENEVEDIWATKNKEETTTKPSQALKEYSEIQQELKQPMEEALISSTPKKLFTKLNPLETAKNSFWSTVAETNKPAEEILAEDTAITSENKNSKRQLTPETMREVNYSHPPLRHRIEELSKCLTPLIHFEWQSTEKIFEETAEEQEDETDFWSKLEESSQSPELQSKSGHDTSTYLSLFGKEEEQKSSIWNNKEEEEVEDEQECVSNAYDPLKYPEEPREVDTDEEIDFWAEIEAKRLPDDEEDDLTFHRAATFWATQDHNNSVDETPYTPVRTKPFPAKLPDEPAAQDLNIWAALEAHKGEEPVLVDPLVEEENELAQEFDEMSNGPETNADYNSSMFDIASVHEAVVASVWNPPQKEEYQNTQATEQEIDFWSEIEETKMEQTNGDSTEKENSESPNDDLEIKRNNYRKAMAFFTTSIDEPKVESIQSPTEATPIATNLELNSQTEEGDKWNWEAVKEANTDQPKDETPKPEEDQKAKKPPKKERKTKNSIKCKTDSMEDCKTVSAISDLPDVYVEPTLNLRRLSNGLPDLDVNKFNEERKVSVRDRISVFETGCFDAPDSRRNSIQNQSLSVDSSSVTRQSSLSRNSSTQRSESEMEEDDSGVTDMNKLSETETESDSFPELRKMTSYQRAATHSRLFKLLQDDTEGLEEESKDDQAITDELKLRPSRKRVVHNVSITRKQNPNVNAEVETLTQRRERLSLPLRKNTSIDADNPSTPNSPASPIMDQSAANQCVVSDKLVSELVQSLLLKSDSTHLRKLPMEKLQAAAKRVLEEELDSLENTSVDSTPSMTPNDAKKDKSYAEYYNTWSDANGAGEIVPSKSFKALQDSRRSPWTARCPRVLSSKTINSDLTRVSESPEISMRSSKSQSRENSVGRWRKV